MGWATFRDPRVYCSNVFRRQTNTQTLSALYIKIINKPYYRWVSAQILYVHFLWNLSLDMQQIILYCFFMLYKNHIYIYFINLSKINIFLHSIHFLKTLKVDAQSFLSRNHTTFVYAYQFYMQRKVNGIWRSGMKPVWFGYRYYANKAVLKPIYLTPKQLNTETDIVPRPIYYWKLK